MTTDCDTPPIPGPGEWLITDIDDRIVVISRSAREWQQTVGRLRPSFLLAGYDAAIRIAQFAGERSDIREVLRRGDR